MSIATTLLLTSFGLGLLLFAMMKAAQGLLMAPPIRVMVGEYRVVFSQRGWSFVGASVEQKTRIGFRRICVWRTIYTQERRFGDKPWGYSMRELNELPAHKLEQLASKLVSDLMGKLDEPNTKLHAATVSGLLESTGKPVIAVHLPD